MNEPTREPRDMNDLREAHWCASFDETIPPDLKVEINTFLWTRLPPNTTLGEADALACEWYEAIRTRWVSAERAHLKLKEGTCV